MGCWGGTGGLLNWALEAENVFSVTAQVWVHLTFSFPKLSVVGLGGDWCHLVDNSRKTSTDMIEAHFPSFLL